MAIHPAFPTSPYEVLNPEHRWFPADEDLRDSAYDKLVPPFVNKIRSEVARWRENQYEGASGTSKALLNWWFNRQHIREAATLALIEKRDVSFEFNGKVYKISPAKIVEFVLKSAI